jgi:hypothetical protein
MEIKIYMILNIVLSNVEFDFRINGISRTVLLYSKVPYGY